jgi:hypothetical protein
VTEFLDGFDPYNPAAKSAAHRPKTHVDRAWSELARLQIRPASHYHGFKRGDKMPIRAKTPRLYSSPNRFELFAPQRNDRIDARGTNRGNEPGEGGSESEDAYRDRGGDGIFRIHPEEQILH